MYPLNEHEQQIIQNIRSLAAEHIAPFAAEVDRESRFPSEAIDALGKAGFLGLTVPAEYAGMGQGIHVAVAALDEIAQHCASTAMVVLMHYCGIAMYCTKPEATADDLAAAARGEHLSTLAWSEKGSRSHFWAPVSRAEQVNGHIRLSAEKSWVTSAGHADGYVVSAGAPGADHPTATVLYLLKRDDDGFTVSGPWDSLGLRGNASSPMQLKDVTFDRSRELTEPGKGFDAMLGVVLPLFSTGNAAISVGLCEAATKATCAHLTGAGFEHLKSKLADLPNLRARLAQMRIETDRARAHLAAAVASLMQPGPNTTLMVLSAKAAAAESALLVTDLGMKACGGAAFSKHLTVERNFRDARSANVMAPTTDVLHDFIGKALCGMELF